MNKSLRGRVYLTNCIVPHSGKMFTAIAFCGILCLQLCTVVLGAALKETDTELVLVHVVSSNVFRYITLFFFENKIKIQLIFNLTI